MGGVKINGGSEIIVKFNKCGRGVKINRGGQNLKIFINIGNEWKKRQKCLILMLDLKLSEKKHITKKTPHNSKLKKKYCINKKTNLTT